MPATSLQLLQCFSEALWPTGKPYDKCQAVECEQHAHEELSNFLCYRAFDLKNKQWQKSCCYLLSQYLKFGLSTMIRGRWNRFKCYYEEERSSFDYLLAHEPKHWLFWWLPTAFQCCIWTFRKHSVAVPCSFPCVRLFTMGEHKLGEQFTF